MVFRQKRRNLLLAKVGYWNARGARALPGMHYAGYLRATADDVSGVLVAQEVGSPIVAASESDFLAGLSAAHADATRPEHTALPPPI